MRPFKLLAILCLISQLSFSQTTVFDLQKENALPSADYLVPVSDPNTMPPSCTAITDIIWQAGSPLATLTNNWDVYNYPSSTFRLTASPAPAAGVYLLWSVYVNGSTTPTLYTSAAGTDYLDLTFATPGTTPTGPNSLDFNPEPSRKAPAACRYSLIVAVSQAIPGVCIGASHSENTTDPSLNCDLYKFSASRPKTPEAKNTIKVKVIPTVAENYISVRLDEPVAEKGIPYQIINASGSISLTGKLTNTLSNIDISKLGKGVYIVKIPGSQTATKFVKL